ncbi:MAG: 6-phosphofructokinase [Clostridia bacterium]|nr:6-phosphofructokinase [Clostridia bacterium]
MKKKFIIGQSGGPTAAINATVAGAISRAVGDENVEAVYGMKNGVFGMLNGEYYELDAFYKSSLRDALSTTPSAALGSARHKLKPFLEDDSEYKIIFENLRRANIGYVMLVGGNDSMDTVDKLSGYAAHHGIDDIKIVGAPKTIDNDLAHIDHTPGYGSAAKYIATTLSEIRADCDVYHNKSVTIVEIMGRDAGWLTAASALACETAVGGPDLIYLPERAFDPEQFIADIRRIQETQPVVLVAVSEGVRTADGKYVAEGYQSGVTDAFGHKYLAGTARCLEDMVKQSIGCKTRSVELNVMQRAAAHLLSATDIKESNRLGWTAADAAIIGQSGVISVLERTCELPYEVEYSVKPVSGVANAVKTVPDEMINDASNGVTEAFMQYARPLIEGELYPQYENGLPKYLKLSETVKL